MAASAKEITENNNPQEEKVQQDLLFIKYSAKGFAISEKKKKKSPEEKVH